MSRREIATKVALTGGALLCIALAFGFALLAVDVARWGDTMATDDVRYRVAADDPGLWQADELVPTGLARGLLALRDDIAFREAMRAIRLARLDEATVSDPELALAQNAAQARLEAVVSGDRDQSRRSRAAGLLGVLGLARLASESQDRGALLSSTVASLQLAISLDPGNDEAKYNLELALQRGRGLQLLEGSGGANPTPGGAGAKGAGAGDPGSGY